jgi:hypothetical protein
MVENDDGDDSKCSEDMNSASIEPLKTMSSYTPSHDSDDNTEEIHDGIHNGNLLPSPSSLVM